MSFPSKVTRYPNDLIDVSETNILGEMGGLDPTKFVNYMEDFTDYLGPIGNMAGGVTKDNWVGSGIGASSAVSYPASEAGIITLLTDANIGDNVFLIRDPLNLANIAIGQPTWFKVAIEIVTTNSQDTNFIFGLADEASLTPTDGIFFRRDGVVTNIWNLILLELGVETVSVDIDVGPGGPFTLGFYWDGVDTVFFGLNGTVIGSIPNVTADLLPTPTLVPMFGAQTNITSTATLHLDYIFTRSRRS